MTVDERGTEATAATGAGAVAVSTPATIFRADRPFIFLIQDRLTDTILFLGRVMNPRADSADADGGMAPGRRGDLARLGLRAMIGGALVSCLSACIAGLMV